jgi:hypothetical protein
MLLISVAVGVFLGSFGSEFASGLWREYRAKKISDALETKLRAVVQEFNDATQGQRQTRN